MLEAGDSRGGVREVAGVLTEDILTRGEKRQETIIPILAGQQQIDLFAGRQVLIQESAQSIFDFSGFFAMQSRERFEPGQRIFFLIAYEEHSGAFSRQAAWGIGLI